MRGDEAHAMRLAITIPALDEEESIRSIIERSLDAKAEILERTGVNVGFGTDLLGDMHEHQLSEFRIRSEVLPADVILRQATSGNAALLEREGELGVIAAGACADLIVTERDPVTHLEVFDDPAGVRMVVKGGVVMKESA